MEKAGRCPLDLEKIAQSNLALLGQVHRTLRQLARRCSDPGARQDLPEIGRPGERIL